MEYVPGVTLRRFCRHDQLLSLDQIVEIGFKCAMALGYVYRQGLIHRDVKPANLLAVVEDDHVIDVKVTDFGSVLNLTSDRTQIFRVGSLAYMSPEQLDGGTLDCRADIYSLAAVLYHLIAGRPPFDATTQTAMMNQIYTAVPPPLTSLREGVPPSLDAVIQHALAKQPHDRPATWDEFAQALSTAGRQPRDAARPAAGRARLRALQPAALARVLRRLRRRGAVGGGAPRALAALQVRATRSTRRGQEGRTFHILAQGEVEVFRDGQQGGATRRRHVGGRDVLPGAERRPAPPQHRRRRVGPCTTISFTPETIGQLAPGTRHLFDAAFIRVLVRRLHAAHEAIAHPRRIL